tara:strand:+ start:8431 stop:9513 length:1083 start_codon:yes stop_codon:yes gene_type:complete
MKILLTGHLGYIGSVLEPLLEKAGHTLTGLDSGLFRASQFGSRYSGIPFWPVDIRDVRAEHLHEVEAVVHLAGFSNDPLGNLDPEITQQVNHTASAQLAKLARDAGVRRFVFASTCSVYGASGDALVDEQSTTLPVTPYALAKLASERDIRALQGDDFETVCLRFATAYGDSPMLRFDLVANNLTAWALATGQIRLKSDGRAWRPLVHVEAVAEAIACALTERGDLVSGEIVNIGDPRGNQRVIDIANMVATAIPTAELSFAEGASADLRSYRVGFDKMADVLPSFHYRWDPAEMICRMRDAMMNQDITPEDFEGARFARLAQLQQLRTNGLVDETYRFSAAVNARRPMAISSAIEAAGA